MKRSLLSKSVLAGIWVLVLLLAGSNASAQSKLTEEAITKDFLKFIASTDSRETRVDKLITPWKLSEVYANDSLWAKVNFSDESRILARTGWFGAGPLLKYDHGFTPKDFQVLKRKIRSIQKKQWEPADFPESVMVLPDKALASSAYYAYSVPLVFPEKKLVIIKRRYHSEKVTNRWQQIEVYQMQKLGKYSLVNTYLRLDS